MFPRFMKAKPRLLPTSTYSSFGLSETRFRFRSPTFTTTIRREHTRSHTHEQKRASTESTENTESTESTESIDSVMPSVMMVGAFAGFTYSTIKYLGDFGDIPEHNSFAVWPGHRASDRDEPVPDKSVAEGAATGAVYAVGGAFVSGKAYMAVVRNPALVITSLGGIGLIYLYLSFFNNCRQYERVRSKQRMLF